MLPIAYKFEGNVLRGKRNAEYKLDDRNVQAGSIIYGLGNAIVRAPIEKRDILGKRMLGEVTSTYYFGNDDSNRLIITEGLEDALSIRAELKNRGARFAVCGSGSHFKNFKPDRAYKNVEVWADNDRAGREVAETLASRIGAKVVYPPRGFKDFNEFLGKANNKSLIK